MWGAGGGRYHLLGGKRHDAFTVTHFVMLTFGLGGVQSDSELLLRPNVTV